MCKRPQGEVTCIEILPSDNPLPTHRYGSMIVEFDAQGSSCTLRTRDGGMSARCSWMLVFGD